MPQLRRTVALLSLVTAQFVAMLDSSILNVALPAIKDDLALTPVGSAWVLNAYFLTFGGFLLLSGRAADLFGRRRMFLTGSALLVASSALAALAGNETVLIAARMLQGLGAAVLTPAALSLLLVTFAGPAKAKAMSAWGAASTAGGALGVSAGGLIVGALGWQWVFWLTGAVALGNALLAARVTARDLAPIPRRFDVAGAVTVTGAALALVAAILAAPDAGVASPEVLAGLAAAVLLGALFVAAERRAAEPIVPLELFRSVTVSAGVVVNLLGGAGRIASFFLVALYLQEALRYAPTAAGLAMLPTSLAGFAVTVLLLPKAISRWGATRTMIVGLLLVGAAHLWLARGPVAGSYVLDVLPGLLLAAAGVALSFTPTTLVITSGLPAERAGIGSGMASASAQLGGALGIAAFSALQAASSAGGGTGHSPAFLGAAVSALVAAGIAIVLLLGRRALPARLGRTTAAPAATAVPR